MQFSEFALSPRILEALTESGYETATAIQEGVIKAALEGKNIVGQSQTGTGKTAAFVVPTLNMIDPKHHRPQVLVLSPTRELANQTRDEFFKLSKNLFVKSTVITGGMSTRIQIENLQRGAQIVVATPGRLIDLMERRKIDLSHVTTFILDEVDRMLDMGFIEDIDHIWGQLTSVKQSMTFSATIPDEVENLLAKYVGEGYELVKVSKSVMTETIDHAFISVPHFDKFEMLKQFIDEHKDQKVVVFTKMKYETEELSDQLEDAGYTSCFLHGDMEQRQRMRSLKRFQANEVQVFVTTDVAARGLNLNQVDLVINYHVPEDPEAYIHRIGRTGRAGASGRAIMFVSDGEKRYLKNIERRNKIRIKEVDIKGAEVERKEERQGAGRGGFGGRNRFGGGGGGRSFGGGGRGGFGGRSEGRSFGGDRGGRSFGGGREDRGAGRDGGYAASGRSDRGGFGSRPEMARSENEGHGGSWNGEERQAHTFTKRPQAGFEDFSDLDSLNPAGARPETARPEGGAPRDNHFDRPRSEGRSDSRGGFGGRSEGRSFGGDRGGRSFGGGRDGGYSSGGRSDRGGFGGRSDKPRSDSRGGFGGRSDRPRSDKPRP